MLYQPELLFSVKAHHGEGPVWDSVQQQFYWVDLMQGQYFRGDWQTQEVETHTVGQPLGFVALREKGGMVMALRDGFYYYDDFYRQLTLIDPTEKSVAATRFNDGAIDPQGRLWAGTMTYDGQEPIGNLYRLDTNGQVTRHASEVLLTNGMGWTTDHRTFYYTDTMRHVIYAYDFEPETGLISKRRNFIEFDTDTFPDGLTVDAQNGLWVAIYGKGKVSRFDAEGHWLEDILLPVSQVTSCCFGGPHLKHLLITTSQQLFTPEKAAQEPLAGRCFVVETNVTGQVEPRFKG